MKQQIFLFNKIQTKVHFYNLKFKIVLIFFPFFLLINKFEKKNLNVISHLSCVEFALGMGFRELVIEGDNTTFICNITDFGTSSSRLAHIFLDSHSSLVGLSSSSVSFIHKEGNYVAHSSTRFARHIFDDVIQINDSPPPVLESLYFDLAHISS